MRRKKIVGLKGNVIERLYPQSETDWQEIDEKISAGKIDDHDSFSDDPETAVKMARQVEQRREKTKGK